MDKSQHFAEEAMRVAERLDDTARLVGARMALGVTLLWQGKLEPALAHFRRGLEMFDPNMQFPDWPGSHPGVQCQFQPTLISWMLGYPDRSLEELRAAVRSAETLGHPFTSPKRCVSLRSFTSFATSPRRPPTTPDGLCGSARSSASRTTTRWPFVRTDGRSAPLAKARRGLAQIAQGKDSYGHGVFQHLLLALQADAQLAIGQPQAALASVASGLKAVEKAGGAPLAAELWRLKGKALLAETASEAETAMQQGIAVARRQNAKSWELRGAMSLARLWAEQGRRSEARDLLAPIYAWFTEGFDTADLKDAKTLLDKLTEPAPRRSTCSKRQAHALPLPVFYSTLSGFP
ncbi:MAG: hypothetical protein WA709_02090 [Stellaceae bacterium]